MRTSWPPLVILTTAPLSCCSGPRDAVPIEPDSSGGVSAAGAGPSSGGSSGGSPESSGGARASGGQDSGGSGSLGGGASGGAGTGATGGGQIDSDLVPFFPPSVVLTNRLAAAGDTVTVVASTIIERDTGLDFYAAIRNDGVDTACDTALTVEFFDRTGESVGAATNGVFGGHLYQADDGSGTVIACFEPGDTGIAAIDDIPMGIAPEQLSEVVYQFAFFNVVILPFGLVPFAGVTLSGVEASPTDSGVVFRGALQNHLDVAIENALVAVFPLSSVGRPLEMARIEHDAEIAGGQSWEFETPTVPLEGRSQAAFFSALIPP